MENPSVYDRQTNRAQWVKWALLSAAVLLAMVTIFSLRYVERFYTDQEQVLQDPQFQAGDAHWQVTPNIISSQNADHMTITNNVGASHKVFQTIEVDTPAFYQFSFDASVKDVVSGGDLDWENANAAVIFRDKDGERTGSKMIMNLVGSHPTQSYSEMILLRDTLGSVDLAFRLYNSGGEFTFTSPVVSRLQELSSYKIMRIGLMVAWGLLFLGLVVLLIRVASVWNLLALAALVAVALVGVIMPESIMTGANKKIASVLPQTFLSESRRLLALIYDGNRLIDAGSEVSKIGHFIVFMLLGFLAGLNWQRIGLLFAVVCLAAFAIATEALQMMVNGRTTSVGDLITDMAGGLVGLAIGICVLWIFQAIVRLVKKPVPSDDHRDDAFENREYDIENY